MDSSVESEQISSRVYKWASNHINLTYKKV